MQKRSQRNLMDPSAYKHYYWYNTVLQEELYEVPNAGYVLQVFHWSIESSIRGAFCMRQQQFTSVSMIIGPTMEYWFGVNVKARETITKRGRYFRQKPSNPDDQFCYMLPKSELVVASCNSCQQYFKRATHKRDCPFITPTMTLSSLGVQRTTIDHSLATSKRNCDKELFATISEQHENGGGNDDDDDGDGDQRDILFFRISLSKFRRMNFNDKCNMNMAKLHKKWTLRMTVIEELVEY